MCVYVCVFLLEVKQLCLLHGLRNLETMTNHVIQKRSFIPLRKAQYWFWTERTASLWKFDTRTLSSNTLQATAYQIISSYPSKVDSPAGNPLFPSNLLKIFETPTKLQLDSKRTRNLSQLVDGAATRVLVKDVFFFSHFCGSNQIHLLS